MLDARHTARSPASFKGNLVAFLRHLKETGEPILLTVDGQTELVVEDEKSYLMLLELVDRLETLGGIREGLEDMRAGRTKTLEEVREEFCKQHGLPG